MMSAKYSIKDDHHQDHGVEANNCLDGIKLSIVVDVEKSRKYDHFPQTLQEDLQHHQSHQIGTQSPRFVSISLNDLKSND